MADPTRYRLEHPSGPGRCGTTRLSPMIVPHPKGSFTLYTLLQEAQRENLALRVELRLLREKLENDQD